MVHKCCVESCCNLKRPNLVFHRLPLGNPERLEQWLCALNMDVNTPLHTLNKLFVCQKHFQPDDYHSSPDQPRHQARHLKNTAIPTLFSHTGDPTAGDIYLDPLVSLDTVT